MITLGTVQIGKGLVWEEENQYTGVIQSVRQTLGGRSHVYSRENVGPMPITLSSVDDGGWVRISVVKQLEAMARDAFGSYTLTLGPRTFTVSFRHSEPPVISRRLLIPRTVPADDDICALTLKLVTYTP